MSRKFQSFSDFIQNATEDEKREVYERAMDAATARQLETMRAPSVGKCGEPVAAICKNCGALFGGGNPMLCPSCFFNAAQNAPKPLKDKDD